MAGVTENIKDVIRFLVDARPGEDSKLTAGEAAHSQSTEELTRQMQAQPQSPIRTQELLVPTSPEAIHPQLATVLGREASPQP